MFLKIAEFLKKSQPLGVPHRGTVVDNDDPLKIGRVKCQIVGLFDDIDTENLPWLYPLFPPGLGGKSGISWFGVPVMESELVVTFPFQDPYTGFYIGFWPNADNHNTAFDEDYPDTYGWKDNFGNQIKVNQNSGVITITHGSGATTVTIADDGEVTVDAPKVTLCPAGGGVITTESQCPFTKSPHRDGSTKVFAGK